MALKRNSSARRSLQLAAGLLLMMVGPLIGLVSPVPVGFVVFAVGLALVLRASHWAKKRYVRTTRRYPKLRRAMDAGMRRRRRVAVPTVVPDPAGELTGREPAPTSPRV